ncbi:glycosyltransferase [Sulfitobacter sp.]|uniref:glycosyltransferase n=1 Tax=Sulfitobacter sp. TaxID=1903071 RepID=UPI003001405C
MCVDDGSSDATLELLRREGDSDPRIRFVQNIGEGANCARNFGALIFANGDVIAFCDPGDIWAPDKLSQLAVSFDGGKADAVFGKVTFFHDDPTMESVSYTTPSGPLSIPVLLGEDPVHSVSNIAVRRPSFLRSGGFKEDLKQTGALDWLIRLVGTGAHVVGTDRSQTWCRSSKCSFDHDLRDMHRTRGAALEAAAQFGHTASAQSEAIFLRRLSHRALLSQQARAMPLIFALEGVLRSPAGFFNPPRRGFGTLFGALLSSILPSRISRMLFAL